MLRAGAVAFTLLAGATAAALILAHYSGFDSWPNLLSGSKGTNAGSASLRSGPAAGGGGSFLDLGPGGLPFASGAGGTATLPPPGVAPAGTGLFIVDGSGPDGNGVGNGGNGNNGEGNGGNPGGATTGPGQGGPGAPAGPGAPGGTPQPPSGGEPPGAGPGTGGPGTTPGGGGGGGEEPTPPSKPEEPGGDGGCNDGKDQSIAASDSHDGAKSGASASDGEDFEGKDSDDGEDFEGKDSHDGEDFEGKDSDEWEVKSKPAETHEPVETEEAVALPVATPAPPEPAVVQETDPESIPAPPPAD